MLFWSLIFIQEDDFEAFQSLSTQLQDLDKIGGTLQMSCSIGNTF